jgi:hypothetical protein
MSPNDLELLNGSVIPFPSIAAKINQYFCVYVMWIGLLASIWLLATNAFHTHTPSTKLLLSVSVADILFFVTCIISSTWNEIAGGFALGETGCYVNYFFIVGPACISITTLGLVAWERYQIICRGNQLSEFQINAMIFLTWFYCLGKVSIPFLTNNPQTIQLEPNAVCCNVRWYDRSVPSIILTLLCIAMVTTAYSIAAFSYYNVYLTYKNTVGKKKQDNQRIIFEKCVVITLNLLVFWTPYYLKIIFEIATGTSAGATWASIGNISGLLCSFFNPIIMGKYDNRVRGNMTELWTHLKRRISTSHSQSYSKPFSQTATMAPVRGNDQTSVIQK